MYWEGRQLKLVMSFVIIILLLSAAGIFFANETTVVTSENGAQSIDSKGKLQIINCTLIKQENNAYLVVGYIRNKGNDMIHQVRIKTRLYNRNNQLLCQSTKNEENIGNEPLKFGITTPILNEAPARYTVEIEYSKF